MRVTWALPPLLGRWRQKPAALVEHLVGHEGAGSLLSALRKRGWATELTAGVGVSGLESSRAGALFRVDVTLTLAGLDKWPRVLGLLHRYLGLVQSAGPQKWVFDEVGGATRVKRRRRSGVRKKKKKWD